MKKSILVLMSAMAFAATAQTQNKGEVKTISDRVIGNQVSERMAANAKAIAAGAESRWLNYGEAIIENEFGGFDVLLDNEFALRGRGYMDLDTNAVIEYSNGLFPVQVHSAAVVINPADEYYDYLDENNDYVLDSVEVVYNYFRNSASSVVDTAIVKVLSSQTNGIQWTAESQDRWAQQIPYVTNTDLTKFGEIAPALTEQTFTVLLTEADTSTTVYQTLMLDVADLNYTAGERVGVTVTFKPGQSYNLGDTLDNFFAVTAFQEDDQAAVPDEMVYANEESHSYELSNRTRYQLNTQALTNATLLPTSFLWYASYSSQHYYIRTKISSPNVGLEDLNEIGATMYPNPTTGVIKIDTDVNQTEVEIFNMLGQKVVSVIENGNFEVDITDQKAGIYFVTIRNEKGTATSKIVKK